MIRFFLFILFFACSASAFSAEKEPILSHDGYGLIKFGTPLKTVEDKLAVKPVSLQQFSSSGCGFVSFSLYPNVAFMIEGKDEEHSKIVRADTIQGQKNSLDIDVGTALSVVKSKYAGKICELDSLYIDDKTDAKNMKKCPLIIAPWEDNNSHYLMFPSKDGKKAFIAEEFQGKIITIRAGFKEAVRLVEGCS